MVCSYHPGSRSVFHPMFKDHTQTLNLYGIFTYIYPKNDPNVGKYSIHGASGIYPIFFGWNPTVFFAVCTQQFWWLCIMTAFCIFAKGPTKGPHYPQEKLQLCWFFPVQSVQSHCCLPSEFLLISIHVLFCCYCQCQHWIRTIPGLIY